MSRSKVKHLFLFGTVVDQVYQESLLLVLYDVSDLKSVVQTICLQGAANRQKNGLNGEELKLLVLDRG